MSTQSIYDQWGKALFGLPVLAPLNAQTEVELSPEPLRIDLLLAPKPRLPLATCRLLGAALELSRAPCALLELNSTVPAEVTLTRSVRKYLKVTEDRLSQSSLTFICSEPSDATLRILKATAPADPALSGFYEVAGLGLQRLVVIPELPTVPETLFLRLLGRGRILRDALLEIQSRPRHDPFHQVTALLGSFRQGFEQRGVLAPLQEEFDMNSLEFAREFFRNQKREQRRLKKERLQHEQACLQHEQERIQHEQERVRMLARLGARLLKRELGEDEIVVLRAWLVREGGDVILERWLGATPAQVEAWLQRPPAEGDGEG